MSIFNEVLKIVAVAAPLVLQAQLNKGEPGRGAERKAQVVEAIDAILAEPGGLDFPSWLPESAHKPLISGCIELTVFLFDKAGGPELLKKFGL